MEESSQNSSTSDIDELVVERIETDSVTDKVMAQSPVEDPVTGSEALADILGIAAPDDAQKDKLDYIWEYYLKGRDREDAIDAMRADQIKLGAPELGETYLHKFYSYVRILADIRGAEKEKKAYEHPSEGRVD